LDITVASEQREVSAWASDNVSRTSHGVMAASEEGA
jgi:hypothetical protein